jgi:hypothetical protein
MFDASSIISEAQNVSDLWDFLIFGKNGIVYLLEELICGFHEVAKPGIIHSEMISVVLSAGQRFFGKPDKLAALMLGKR